MAKQKFFQILLPPGGRENDAQGLQCSMSGDFYISLNLQVHPGKSSNNFEKHLSLGRPLRK